MEAAEQHNFSAFAPFGIVPRNLINAFCDLGKGVAKVLLHIAALVRVPGEWVRIGHKRLAEVSGLDSETVRKYIRLAERKGLVKRRYRWGDDGEQKCNEYQLQLGTPSKPAEKKGQDEKKRSNNPLGEAIARYAAEWLAEFREQEEIEGQVLEDERAALQSPLYLYRGCDERGNGIRETAYLYTLGRLKTDRAFRGMRERDLIDAIKRFVFG